MSIVCNICGSSDIKHEEKTGRGLPPKGYVKKKCDNRRISWKGIWDVYTCNKCGDNVKKLRT